MHTYLPTSLPNLTWSPYFSPRPKRRTLLILRSLLLTFPTVAPRASASASPCNLPHHPPEQTVIALGLDVPRDNDRLAEMHVQLPTHIRGAHVDAALVHHRVAAGEELGRDVALVGRVEGSVCHCN